MQDRAESHTIPINRDATGRAPRRTGVRRARRGTCFVSSTAKTHGVATKRGSNPKKRPFSWVSRPHQKTSIFEPSVRYRLGESRVLTTGTSSEPNASPPQLLSGVSLICFYGIIWEIFLAELYGWLTPDERAFARLYPWNHEVAIFLGRRRESEVIYRKNCTCRGCFARSGLKKLEAPAGPPKHFQAILGL